MTDLFDDDDHGPDSPGGNSPALSVSEISGTVRRVIEGEFGRVRVRGEVSRVSRPRSGHLYFDLKDDNAVLASICWKGQAAKLATQPEEGAEVIATGRLTTYPGQSRYQMIVENIEHAGMGALMAMLEKRRAALAAEGLFDAARKKPLPALPRVIGVVTSPSGAVIRDILHRLRDRFPVHVLIWPVAVQGQSSGAEVAAAINGFNAMPGNGPIPRPDLLIVARGGGSIEDLWGFNDEAVVRATAASQIPLISAVGHETDTTLIDHAADRRAPTPTAAAEMAVPVRADLVARIADLGNRQARAAISHNAQARQRLRDLTRALGRPQILTEAARQRLDLTGPRLEPALRGLVVIGRAKLAEMMLRPSALRNHIANNQRELQRHATALPRALQRNTDNNRRRLDEVYARLNAGMRHRLDNAIQANKAGRLRLGMMHDRLPAAMTRHIGAARDMLARLDRLRETLSHHATMKRGFAVIHGPEAVIKTAKDAASVPIWQVEFADGTIAAAPLKPGKPTAGKPAQKPPSKPSSAKPPKAQGTLF